MAAACSSDGSDCEVAHESQSLTPDRAPAAEPEYSSGGDDFASVSAKGSQRCHLCKKPCQWAITLGRSDLPSRRVLACSALLPTHVVGQAEGGGRHGDAGESVGLAQPGSAVENGINREPVSLRSEEECCSTTTRQDPDPVEGDFPSRGNSRHYIGVE